MKKLLFPSLPSVLVTAVLIGPLSFRPARAAVFPVATNPAVMEFAGGAVKLGTNYLVGYIAGTNLTGQLVSGAGQLLGAPQTLGANPGFPPAAVVAGAQANALIAWSDTSLASGVTMFGQLIGANGSLTGPRFPLLASAGSHGFQFVQAAASDGTNFLVMWQDAANTNFYGQLVTSSGSLAGSEFFLFAPGGGSGQRNVAVAAGATNYLIAWQEGATDNTYGELVSLNGSAGATFQINSTASLDNNPPVIGFDGTNYLVVWNRSQSENAGGWPNWNLCGRLVSQTGTFAGGEQVLVTEQAAFPALGFDGANYLLAWGYDVDTTNGDHAIHARFLDRSAGAIGPIFTPFPTEGTNPPLLPLSGVLFGGTNYLLTATFGSFIINNGNLQGFLGGDVYGRFFPASLEPPVFTQAAVSGGLFQGQVKLVPGQTYTMEISTNLPDWLPVDTLSSSDTNRLSLTDSRSVAIASRMFYRLAVGNLIGMATTFNFHEFANAGGFGGGYTPAPSYPVTLNNYTAVFESQNDLNPPAATNVFFTGPAGSGLAGTAADPNNSSAANGYYQSPFVTSPAAAPGGTWTVNYHGTNITFNVADPQAVSHLVVPLPTVTVSGNVLQSVSWIYHDAITGAVLAGAPAYVTDLQVQIEGVVGGRIYDSPWLDPSVTSHTLTSTVNWSNVSMIHMAYDDSLGNHYVVSFPNP